MSVIIVNMIVVKLTVNLTQTIKLSKLGISHREWFHSSKWVKLSNKKPVEVEIESRIVIFTDSHLSLEIKVLCSTEKEISENRNQFFGLSLISRTMTAHNKQHELVLQLLCDVPSCYMIYVTSQSLNIFDPSVDDTNKSIISHFNTIYSSSLFRKTTKSGEDINWELEWRNLEKFFNFQISP